MTTSSYQNNLIGKKQLRQLLAWSFTNYNSMQACSLADELKHLGFKQASQAGISISLEDLKIPFVKTVMLEKANQEIFNAEKIYLKGKITDVEKFQKIIDTWSLTSESLKDQIVYYFKNYDPLNSVYVMAFSGARGNLSQVRQLVGMRGLMSDPNGEIMNLPIKKNFREGLTITDYLMSGYGARKGIVDTALKTANSGYLTRRLIDVSQDILIREKDCSTNHSFLFVLSKNLSSNKILGRVLQRSVFDFKTNTLLAKKNLQVTPKLISKFRERNINEIYLRSPLTCDLYRAICKQCYGWDLANENLVDLGTAVGILAGQSIGEPGTQLTMRTFHTGGIFTSEARQQIISPSNGVIQFYKLLKTVLLRTNRGEDVLVTKNSGSLILIPDEKNKELVQIEVLRNTILFPKNNQYILRDTVIGELINTNKQLKKTTKTILSSISGEISIPRLKSKVNRVNNNQLIWILSGQLYNSPASSFLNFYSDYKLNQHTYIFRTKIINPYSGFVEFCNSKVSLSQSVIKIVNNKYSVIHATFKKLKFKKKYCNYLLLLNSNKYFIQIRRINLCNYLQLTKSKIIGTLAANTFRTLTGGTVYYQFKNVLPEKEKLIYFKQSTFSEKYKPTISYRTLIWLGEEIHKVECEKNILFVNHGDFISKNFELIPGHFSKTSGLVSLKQKNNIVQTITIKSGIVYEGKKFRKISKKIYYPGEILFTNIRFSTISFCEQIVKRNVERLLIRSIQLYEFPHCQKFALKNSSIFLNNSKLGLENEELYSYKSKQTIKNVKRINLVSNILVFNPSKLLNKNIQIELTRNTKKKSVSFKVSEQFSLNNYILPYLKYKNLQSCFLIQKFQFISPYTTLGYFESLTLRSLEVVKFKVKHQKKKQILLISNDDCWLVPKNRFPNKQLNDFVTTNPSSSANGQIIIQNDTFLTVQKGQSYFFPNCKSENLISQTSLQYKFISPSRFKFKCITNRNLTLNYYNVIKTSIQNKTQFGKIVDSNLVFKSEFSKLFFKNNRKLYSCLTPQFFRKFSINNRPVNLPFHHLLKPQKQVEKKASQLLLIKSSEILRENKLKNLPQSKTQLQLTLLEFIEQPFSNLTKAIGLYAITEDYFEQEVNSVFCKHDQFIETGTTIGLLNLEKEITGDIVQGLPRIEEILEARKKNLNFQRVPTGKKKSLLVQKTSLDTSFEFKKLGTTIQENDKINPHKLLKVYFNYYGLTKLFLCNRSYSTTYSNFVSNYEGSYKSFKKVQTFIINSVQTVYQSQGVTINDKHLEIIINQMTTKVLITYEGNTPLLKREVIDLYHIQYINKIIKNQKKQVAYYVPLLLGITKAALNNPSFISAASFQETTRVLTKAAIEGQIDWLRGLKENIVIGHLIPVGTGFQNYQYCFKKYSNKNFQTKLNLNKIEKREQKSRQVF